MSRSLKVIFGSLLTIGAWLFFVLSFTSQRAYRLTAVGPGGKVAIPKYDVTAVSVVALCCIGLAFMGLIIVIRALQEGKCQKKK